MNRARTLSLAAAVTLPLLTGACALTGTASTTNSTRTPAAGAAASPSDPDAGLLTGAKLKALLVSDMPPGFTLDSSGSVDTGDVYQVPSTIPTAAKPACDRLTGTAWIDAAPGPSAVSFAQNDYLDKNKDEIAQEIDVFQGGGAATVMTSLRRVLGACATFTLTDQGATVTVHVATAPVPGLGEDAFKAVVTSPSWQGGTTLVAARAGNAVVTAFYSTAANSKGSEIIGLATQIVRSLNNAG